MSRWVQHMSGQGKKYELTDDIWNRENNSSWEAHNSGVVHAIYLILYKLKELEQ